MNSQELAPLLLITGLMVLRLGVPLLVIILVGAVVRRLQPGQNDPAPTPS